MTKVNVESGLDCFDVTLTTNDGLEFDLGYVSTAYLEMQDTIKGVVEQAILLGRVLATENTNKIKVKLTQGS